MSRALIWRIYQAGRNDKNQSHVGWALIDLEQPDRVIERSVEPVLTPGPLGAFDDNGVLPSCLIRDGGETLLYYIGFKPGGTTRMDLYGGLAARTGDDGPFERLNRAPIIERCHVNPSSIPRPGWCVMARTGGCIMSPEPSGCMRICRATIFRSQPLGWPHLAPRWPRRDRFRARRKRLGAALCLS
jgi:hypothetical protein